MLSHEDLLKETVNEGHWERPSPVSVCAAIFLEQELSIDMISQDSSELGVGGEQTIFFFFFFMFSQGPSEYYSFPLCKCEL